MHTRAPGTRHPLRALVSALVASVGVMVVAGCSAPAVHVPPAPSATDPGCARVLASLNGADQVAGLQRRGVTSQSVAAWGNPPVVLRCGVNPPGPTTQACVDVDGVDWVGPPDPEKRPATYTTYGRLPAVEITLPDTKVGMDAVLGEIAPAVAQLPQSRRCL
ncbi:MAG: DUF3515 domain-containing protein [Actinomycetes bacterium]